MARAQTRAAVSHKSMKMRIKAMEGQPLSCAVDFRLDVSAHVAHYYHEHIHSGGLSAAISPAVISGIKLQREKKEIIES